ncbi:MAG: NAD(P)/FAD-dependent oxidoreductase [Pseudomonadota bacterium]
MSETKKTQIVVVGGGAGGLELVRRLGAKYGRKTHDIILVERNLTHIWKPLLHEVAAGSLDANLDEVGYGAHGARWGYRFFRGTLESVDRDRRVITTAPLIDEDGEEIVGRHTIRFDYLVLAVGAVSNDFGTPGVKDHCLFLESRANADRFRARMLNACLKTSQDIETGANPDARVRIAIVGGGATGVELSAALVDSAESLKNYGLEVFDRDRLSITLLEAGPRILPALPEKLSKAAHEELEDMGVRVMTGAMVTSAEKTGLLLKDGARVEASLKLWAAGVKGQDSMKTLGDLSQNRGNQFIVRPTLQTLDDDRIFAIGDCASYTPAGAERPIPPRAQAANQMATTAFKNLVALQDNKPLTAFTYNDKGSLVSLARFQTVGSLMGNLVGGRMAVEGRVARLVYNSLYRLHILGIHGTLGGLSLLALRPASRAFRPRLKLH